MTRGPIPVRFNDDDHAVIEELKARSGLTLPDLVRLGLRLALRRLDDDLPVGKGHARAQGQERRTVLDLERDAQDVDRHLRALDTLLATIERMRREGLWRSRYRSFEAYAAEELGLTPRMRTMLGRVNDLHRRRDRETPTRRNRRTGKSGP